MWRVETVRNAAASRIDHGEPVGCWWGVGIGDSDMGPPPGGDAENRNDPVKWPGEGLHWVVTVSARNGREGSELAGLRLCLTGATPGVASATFRVARDFLAVS
jgi:hypothetical protein